MKIDEAVVNTKQKDIWMSRHGWENDGNPGIIFVKPTNSNDYCRLIGLRDNGTIDIIGAKWYPSFDDLDAGDWYTAEISDDLFDSSYAAKKPEHIGEDILC